jgi:adenylosuccinate lyase
VQGTRDGRETGDVITRYELPEMAGLFTDEAKLGRWLEIELLATEGQAALGVVPVADAAECRDRAPVVDAAFAAACAAREQVTDHDVAAFVDVAQARIGGAAPKWIHHGLTSSDVVDTAWCWALRDAADLLDDASSAFVHALKDLALRHRDTVMVGRTHGIHAEPTTFGLKLGGHALESRRNEERLRDALEGASIGTLSGAVGTYAMLEPAIEAAVLAELGIGGEPIPTQVVARDRHAQLVCAMAVAASSLDRLATELRHLQRTELREAEEAFTVGQKGSSAMPHKRNPITAERISGIARVVRGHAVAALEDVALWHERDISHSSVERIILPDASSLAYYVLRKATSLIGNLQVFPDRMRANLDRSYGLVFSQPVLLALVAEGLSRDEAYRIVQEQAMRAWQEGVPFRDLLAADTRVPLDEARLDDAFGSAGRSATSGACSRHWRRSSERVAPPDGPCREGP